MRSEVVDQSVTARLVDHLAASYSQTPVRARPEHFDSMTASNSDLRDYGYRDRPDPVSRTQAYHERRHVTTLAICGVEQIFGVRRGLRDGEVGTGAEHSFSTAGTLTTWESAVATADRGDPFESVVGVWAVFRIRQPHLLCDPLVGCRWTATCRRHRHTRILAAAVTV